MFFICRKRLVRNTPMISAAKATTVDRSQG